ncbi:small ribosomal subunit Rsm22 family protein [Halorussus lipolyticus]|uniref:small ribosomal subunit Rsm22 family protein n=1 Tax=Halorussus lipolyticus TaxID=3034024 RepID=UPI0023E88867|nr:class I SAM-dependent methyltransferase [Halorussus sp. DT80]
MNDELRRKVRENAKYLRNVRPIDADEIAEYIESQPHPGVVRQILREEAGSLGLVEREDRTFAPVEDEPIAPTFRGVEAFPPEYGHKLEDLLADRFGLDWQDGASGDELRSAIRKLKTDYYWNNPVEYDETAALGYAIYHLPDNYAVVQYVLHELGEEGLLGRDLRVLDVGAGVGGPALGMADYLPDDVLVRYDAIEPSAPAADIFDHMLEDAGRNFYAECHREVAEEFAVPDDREYDLLVFANVLNELDDPEAVVRRYLDSLADDGAVLAIEPADRETAIGLREVERAIADERNDATVFSPTLRLWPGERPTDRGWSFDVKPDLDVPGFQRKLDEGERGPDAEREGDAEDHPAPGSGEFVNRDVQFAYSILRPDGKRKLDFTADTGRTAKMAEMDRHVTNRIDLVAVKLSHSLAEGDRNPLFKVSDGSEAEDHFAVLTRETSLNRDLKRADYGDLLSFESVLALWNDDEEAYNLVVDEETVVDAVPV